jgi:uncharacterized damage-inducible protein DinB
MIPTRDTLVSLFAYNRWATDRVLDAAAALAPEELVRPVGGSFGTVQATFAHVYGADWVWLERCHGRSPSALPPDHDLSSVEAIRTAWAKVHEGHSAFVATVAPERLAAPLTYVNFAGQTLTYPLGAALLHVANHGTYHRGQVVTLLRQLGHKAVSTDYIRFLDAAGK